MNLDTTRTAKTAAYVICDVIIFKNVVGAYQMLNHQLIIFSNVTRVRCEKLVDFFFYVFVIGIVAPNKEQIYGVPGIYAGSFTHWQVPQYPAYMPSTTYNFYLTKVLKPYK